MPEFDQSGGSWASGRPSYAGRSDQDAYNTYLNFYLNTKKLSGYLTPSTSSLGYSVFGINDFNLSAQYGLDLGIKIMAREVNIDEMPGLIPSLAFQRGGASQHGGLPWGFDFSAWRYWTNGPTEYYSSGALKTGWSAATLQRNLYIAFMGGANIIHFEAADLYTGASGGDIVNPMGRTLIDFYDFAVKRHPGRGQPQVTTAIMQDHYSGFDPKFGEWCKYNNKWYYQNPYTPGDSMLANLLDHLYPSHSSWGTIQNLGAPVAYSADGTINIGQTQANYRNALASGADPRRWEPFGSSRYGETIDVITNQASLATLQKYPFVILSANGPIGSSLLTTLASYVGGGILLVRANQLSASTEMLTGVHPIAWATLLAR
jgi:hypothetical protein